MPARSPEERALVARIANAERLAKHPDRRTLTAAARNGLRAKFEREVDPDQKLTADVRSKLADDRMRAHMLRMSLRAAQGRRQAREHAAAADAAESELQELGGPLPMAAESAL